MKVNERSIIGCNNLRYSSKSNLVPRALFAKAREKRPGDEVTSKSWSAYHLYGNFGVKFPSNGHHKQERN